MLLSRAFLDELHCPYCGSPLELEQEIPPGQAGIRHGVLRCACYRYPVLDGIAILQQPTLKPHIGMHPDDAVEYLRRGDVERAISTRLTLPARMGGRLLARLGGLGLPLARKLEDHYRRQSALRIVSDPSLDFRHAVAQIRPGPFGHYLFHRYANPSFLAAIPSLLLLKELGSEQPAGATLSTSAVTDFGRPLVVSGYADRPTTGAHGQNGRVLDLACGTGHASFLMRQFFPNLSIIAADHDFTALYLARRFLVPDDPCVCIDAEAPLPFPDRFFDAVFCLDAFHYIQGKAALLQEVNRVVREGGLWLFSHMHNALADNPVPGFPLRAEDYFRCFDFVERRLYAESAMLRRFVREQVIDLERVPSKEELRSSNAFCLVGGGGRSLWRRHSDVAPIFLCATSDLGINPIYHIDGDHHRVWLRREWPCRMLESECALAKEILPAHCVLDRALLGRIREGRRSAEDEQTIQELLGAFVLVRLPGRYGHRGFEER